MRGALLLLALSWSLVAAAQESAEAPETSESDDAPMSEGESAPDPEGEDAGDTDAEDPAEIVIVYDAWVVEQKRQAILSEAKSEGYVREIRKKDRTIMRHDAPWKGDLVVYDDGRVLMKRQPVRFEPPIKGSSPARWLACILLPVCIRPGGQTVGKRKFSAVQRKTWSEITDEVHDWQESIADYGLGQKVGELPEKLIRLWELGEPLEGEGTLPTMSERKEAILLFWDSRTENEWGLAVRATVESFLRQVVQNSDTPLTEEELAAFNRNRRSVGRLELETAPAVAP